MHHQRRRHRPCVRCVPVPLRRDNIFPSSLPSRGMRPLCRKYLIKCHAHHSFHSGRTDVPWQTNLCSWIPSLLSMYLVCPKFCGLPFHWVFHLFCGAHHKSSYCLDWRANGRGRSDKGHRRGNASDERRAELKDLLNKYKKNSNILIDYNCLVRQICCKPSHSMDNSNINSRSFIHFVNELIHIVQDGRLVRDAYKKEVVNYP